MGKLLALGILLIVIFISKFLRQLAFGRSDSIALEVAICSFMFNFVIAVTKSASAAEFFENELMRCLVLLLMAFIIAMVHHYYKELCMQQIDAILQKLRTMKKYSDVDEGEYAILEQKILDHTYLIAKQAVDVWYSQFADIMFFRFLKKFDSSEEKSFKKKKGLIRWGFADILNSLPVMQYGAEAKLTDKDLNINNRRQITGMVIFDLMQFLSLAVAIRLI
ncbi:MAG: hypothetical protein K6E85_17680 [Lachnospiraceae bacterium]|nr:hypothetical protein [Lachnospiraceae bacterium]